MPVTLNDLARLAGVSNATVSLALSGKHEGRVGKELRRKIIRLAREHGYRRNLAARALVERRTYRISLCLYGYLATHSAQQEINLYEQFVLYSRGIQTAGLGLDLVEIETSHTFAETKHGLLRRFVDGFVFLYWPPQLLTKLLSSLKEKGIPAVASGTVLKDKELTWAAIDEFAVFEQATRYLISEGHKQIALIDVKSGVAPEAKRDAFLCTVKRELGKDASKWVFPLVKPRVEELIDATDQALDRMKGVRAFLLTENTYAHGVLHALRLKNIRPGRDCRVIGFGETLEATRAHPKLSHYSMKNKEQVQFALGALLAQIEDPSQYKPRHRLFEPELVRLET